MGIILRQSFKGTIISYLGVFIAYLNLIIILPYCLDLDQIGVVRLAIEASVFFSLFFQLGAPYILIRFKPISEKENLKGILGVAGLFALIGIGVFMIFFSLFKEEIGEFYLERSEDFVKYIDYVLPFAIIIILNNLLERYSHANKRIVVPGFLKEVFLRISLGSIVVLYFLEIISFEQVIQGIIVSYVLQFLVLLFYTNRLAPIQLRPSKLMLSRTYVSQIGSYAGFVTVGAIGGGLVGKLDIIMLGSLAGLNEIGIYSTMLYLATIIEMPRRALMQISNPIIAEHIANDEIDKVASLYKKTSINQLIVGTILFLLIWFNIDALFDLMPKGEVFRNGKWVVFIVGVTKLYDLATGINSQILLNSKFYRFSLIAIFLLSILAIASNYLLIPRFGIEGAAAATLISIFLFNSLLLGFIYMKFKIQPFSLQTLKLLLLVALLYIGMSFFPEISNPFLSIGVKTIILTCLFVGFVYFTRISEDINELIRNILQRIKLLKP